MAATDSQGDARSSRGCTACHTFEDRRGWANNVLLRVPEKLGIDIQWRVHVRASMYLAMHQPVYASIYPSINLSKYLYMRMHILKVDLQAVQRLRTSIPSSGSWNVRRVEGRFLQDARRT